MELFLTVNGVGLGHLRRASLAARWLRRAGRRPVILHQGTYGAELARRQPGVSIAPIRDMTVAEALEQVEEIARYARLSQPAIVIEDTHPVWVPFPPDIVRVLMVRPTELAYMRRINGHASFFSRCVILDDPGSPTWPYDADDAAEILSWPDWLCIGPMFRRPDAARIAAVRSRHRLGPDEPVFVFSMGGGGEREGSGDRVRFLSEATRLSVEIRAAFPRARLVFVCGALFPEDLHPPETFEEIREEPDMPSLLAAATGAVIRPGFNTIWECIAGMTPFLSIAGTTRAEPVDERSARLRSAGIEASSLTAWSDATWMDRFRARCADLNARFSGAPARRFIEVLDEAPYRRPAAGFSWTQDAADALDDIAALANIGDALRAHSGPKRLILRLDDVVTIDEHVAWLVAQCRAHSLVASLEIIPYLCTATLAQLDAVDPDGLLEIGQHGFAHLPQGRGSFRSEHVTEAILRRGYRHLRARFRGRFKGGYSAPYDAWTPSLPAAWRAAGGRYISWIARRPPSPAMPSVRVAVDPWDWIAAKRRAVRSIGEQIHASIRSDGYAGIVLHPQVLQLPAQRRLVEQLLDALAAGGCRGASPAALAARPQRVPIL